MAIAHHAVASTSLTEGDFLSFAFVIPAGTNIAGLVGISWVNTGVEDVFIAEVTIDGDECTFIQLRQTAEGSVEQYYRNALSAGSPTVIVAWTGVLTPVVNAIAGIEVASGVHATVPVGAINTATGTSTAPAIVVATTDTDGYLVDTLYVQLNVNTTVNAHASQTPRWGATVGTDPSRLRGAASTETSGAAGTTMSWTLGGSRLWAIAATEFRPAPDPEPPTPSDVNVLTSYHFLEVDPSKLDHCDQLPEIMQKVWANKRQWTGG